MLLKKLIGEITELAVDATNKTKHDVFADYHGHVSGFHVNYHANGYSTGTPETNIIDIYMDREKNQISKLKQAKRKLKKLLEEK
ncbi:hypothetical protein [Clostridium diolis]|uniref:hypothetical protein n=1 Tax=Clostridium diolis TaxID=223919 RepID=UPI003AF64A46